MPAGPAQLLPNAPESVEDTYGHVRVRGAWI